MTALAADPAVRLRRLRALGVQPLRLREAAARSAGAAASEPEAAARLVLVAAAEAFADPRQRRAVEQWLGALGVAADAVVKMPLDGERLATEVPACGAYLALGRSAGRALGAVLPARLRDAATVVVTASSPADWIAQPASRRSAWRSLRPLHRALLDAGR